MDKEQKGRQAKRSGNSTEPTVAADSLQSKPPGAQQSGNATPGSRQSTVGSNAQRAGKQSRYDDTIEGKQGRYDSSRNRGGE